VVGLNDIVLGYSVLMEDSNGIDEFAEVSPILLWQDVVKQSWSKKEDVSEVFLCLVTA
jgi:hypothetical protein